MCEVPQLVETTNQQKRLQNQRAVTSETSLWEVLASHRLDPGSGGGCAWGGCADVHGCCLCWICCSFFSLSRRLRAQKFCKTRSRHRCTTIPSQAKVIPFSHSRKYDPASAFALAEFPSSHFGCIRRKQGAGRVAPAQGLPERDGSRRLRKGERGVCPSGSRRPGAKEGAAV